jgi:Ca-activated chloride channel family protein
MTTLVVWVALCHAAVPGFDDPVLYPPEVYPGEAVTGGELRVVGDDPSGVQSALVLEHSSIVAEVNGGLARVTLIQWFHNPYDTPISATYLLPLPHQAAVDRMEMVCGDRHIEGIVLEREAARALYEEAKADGRKAALLEQERDNLFTQSVSNLCPGEEIELTLQWVEPVGYEDGTYSWSMPLTVGPRYTPPWVEDGERLDTPYDRDGHAVDVTVAIEEGIPIDGLWSDTHDIVVEDEGPWGAEVALEDEETIPNQDFTLNWVLQGRRPQAGIVTSRPDPDEPGWLALTIEPPELGPEFLARPRELVFLVDQSCSMQGEPYAAATAAVARALKGMRGKDTFNVLRFSDDTASLFANSQPSTAETRAQASAWMSAYTGGGTQMEKGLVAALDAPATPGALKLVVLLTDGFVGQDDEIMRLVRQHLGKTRLFSFGVSASPNRSLLADLADVGRGATIYHTPGRSIDEAVRTFQARIAHPAMTDITVDWGGLEVSESFPSRIPDLWAGQPLRLYARYDGAAEDVSVRVSGTVGTRPYTIELPVDVAPPDARHEAVITAWARAKIGDLTRRISNRERLRDAVVDVALDYGLVTRWTSLVAVDDELSACGPSDVDVRIPNQLPADMAGVGGIIGERSTQYGYGAYGYGVGGGGSAYGTGHAHYSAKGRAGIGTVGGDAIIIGSLDKSPIDAVIRREYNRLRYCYQRELQKAPDLAGKIVMAFTIGRDGSVVTAAVKESTMKNQLVEQCVTSRILRLQFDPLAGGGVVKVTYPFLFSTVQAESSPSR